MVLNPGPAETSGTKEDAGLCTGCRSHGQLIAAYWWLSSQEKQKHLLVTKNVFLSHLKEGQGGEGSPRFVGERLVPAATP